MTKTRSESFGATDNPLGYGLIAALGAWIGSFSIASPIVTAASAGVVVTVAMMITSELAQKHK